MKFKIKEEVPTNVVGGGAIAGTIGDPPVPQKTMLKRKQFAGMDVFEVSSDYYHKCRMEKKKYARWSEYVGDDQNGKSIRDYANKNSKKPIIIQDEKTGSMTFLRYGKKNDR